MNGMLVFLAMIYVIGPFIILPAFIVWMIKPKGPAKHVLLWSLILSAVLIASTFLGNGDSI